MCAHDWQGFAAGTVYVVLFTVLCLKWSVKKRFIPKILQGIWETFFYENNRHHNSYKFAFIPFLPFHRNQEQDSNFQQLGGLITRNISVFCL